MYAVAPSAWPRARLSASNSAWGRPPGWVQPRPTTWSSLTTMQPTAGFGQTWPRPRSAKRSATAMNWTSRSLGGDVGIGFGRGALALGRHARDETLEVTHPGEVMIDRSEADVGHLIELGEALHGQSAQAAGLDLGLPAQLDLAHDAVDDAVDALLVDPALARRDHDRALELLAVERDALALALEHGQLAQLDALEGGEARAAGVALAPPANRPGLLDRPRVLDLIIIRTT